MRKSWGIKVKDSKCEVPESLSVMMLIYEDVEPFIVKIERDGIGRFC